MWSLREECSINSRDQNTRRGERSYAERREKQREQEIGRRQRRLRTRPRRAMSQGKRQQERERREWEEREVAYMKVAARIGEKLLDHILDKRKKRI